jgi:hypothetical protein
MNLKALAAGCALAALAIGNAAHAAAVPIEQSITLLNPEGALVYNIATNGLANAPTTSYYELVVDGSWNNTNTSFTTFSTEPLGTNASYALFTDTNPLFLQGNTGALLTSWTQADVPGNNLVPFFTFLLTAGQYVLQINTLPGEMNISTNINAVSSVPLPGAMWLFGSAVLGFLGFTNRRKLSS